MTYRLSDEQLDGMEMWDCDAMLDPRHRAVGAMLVKAAVDELRELRRLVADVERERDDLSAKLNEAHLSGAALTADRNTHREHSEVLQRSLDDALGPHCTSCGNAIDPDCCWCGSGPESKHYDDTHGFIPMGCDCYRADRDWKKLAKARGELLWIEREAVSGRIATSCAAVAAHGAHELEATAGRTAEQIAAWLERGSPDQDPVVCATAAAIRAGAWRS